MNIGVPEPGDRVLWVRFAAFGDVIECVADAHNFKKRFPETHLTFLTSPEYCELIKDQPYVDDVISGRKKPYITLFRTLKKIRAGHYKWFICDHLGGKSSLLALFSGSEFRIGRCYWFFFKNNYQMDLGIWAQRCGFNMKNRSHQSIFVSAKEHEDAAAMLSRLPERRLFSVIGASKARKRWPAERWIEFLRPLMDAGWGIVLNGYGEDEEAIGRQIEGDLNSVNVLNLIGALNFKKMSGVISRCTAAVGNDTGPLHLAALCGVPTFGILNNHAVGTERDLLGIPWFRVLCAEDYVQEKTDPIKSLPAEPVTNAFSAFSEEFSTDLLTRSQSST